MNKYLLIIFFILRFCLESFSQYRHENVFPKLSDQALLTELVNEYKTFTVLDYSNARDTLFGKIDVVNDSIECIYTGMKLYIAPGSDATEAIYFNGIPNGMNTEHTYPQGKGAVGTAQSDMHHLYASRIKANSDRGDHPFGEISDSQTKIWYYKTTERTSPPSVDRDKYSEYINGKFEPRESVKGNIARSIFYFYTMYKDQADAEDPNFFNLQKADLCQWHYQDPVDEAEWNRNQKIATYQGGKFNPFVLDCSLISRAYCHNIDQACESIVLSNAENTAISPYASATIYPNPGHGQLFVQAQIALAGNYSISFINAQGQRTEWLKNMYLSLGNQVIELSLPENAGLYIIELTNATVGGSLYIKYVRL